MKFRRVKAAARLSPRTQPTETGNSTDDSPTEISRPTSTPSAAEVYEKAADDAGVSGIEKEAYVALSLRTEEACRNVKGAARAAGASVDDSIRIFAVAFGFRDEAPMDVASKEMLRRCASTPDSLSPRYFFDAADRDGLEAALQAVLDSLGDGLFISR